MSAGYMGYGRGWGGGGYRSYGAQGKGEGGGTIAASACGIVIICCILLKPHEKQPQQLKCSNEEAITTANSVVTGIAPQMTVLTKQ